MKQIQHQKFLVSKLFPYFVKHNKKFVSFQLIHLWVGMNKIDDV